ncbi:MAG: hypothetical protein ACREJ2_17010 [Planctomycetota bacterium]
MPSARRPWLNSRRRPNRAAAVLIALVCAAAAANTARPLAALDEPAPTFETGYYDWTGYDWGLQHHLAGRVQYDDNPRRENYASHPRPDFAAGLDYGCVLSRYLDPEHYFILRYDAEALAWARYTDLNTVNHAVNLSWNYFDPTLDVTGIGWYLKPRAFVNLLKAPEDFVAGAAPRRLRIDLSAPVGYRLDRWQFEASPLYGQDRYLDSAFDPLDNRDIGGYAEVEYAAADRASALYARFIYRSIDHRRDDLFDDFVVRALRLGWRCRTPALDADCGLDFALFTRLANRAADGTPSSQGSLSPYIDLTWRIEPDASTLHFYLQRLFVPDVAASATALTRVQMRLTQVLSKDLLDAGLNTRVTVSNRLSGGDATLYQSTADIDLHLSSANRPPWTLIGSLGLDINRADQPGASYGARMVAFALRGVF